MPRKKTHQDFLNDVKEKYGDKYTVIGEYKTASTKIKIQCNNCGDIKEVKPYSFIRQKIGCKKCYHNKRKLTFKDIENRLKNETNNEYQLISIGSTVADKIKIRHNCGYEYNVDFGSFFYSGKRCRKCYGTAAISEEEFLDFFNNEMEGYELISNFSKMRDRITIKHLKCGKIYSVEPRSIKNQNARCLCEKSSVGERQIRKILKNKNIDFEEQFKIPNCKNILPLPFDFKITINDKVFLLEYQGIQHFKIVDFFGEKSCLQTQANDIIKKEYCKDNNINLEFINYKENTQNKLIEIINKYANSEPS